MDFSIFKRMCRLLEFQRRAYFEREWRARCLGTFGAELSPRQITHLMSFRLEMPCNLNRIMSLTGLSSSAASLFIDKLVKMGVVCRQTDSADRRNILVAPSAATRELMEEVERKLDAFIGHYLIACSNEEKEAIEKAGEVICRELDKCSAEKKTDQ